MINDEYAVLGKSMMDEKVLDMMLSECTDDHFSTEHTREIFRLIQQCFDKGIRPAPNEIKKMYDAPYAAEWMQECIIQGSKTINLESNFNELIKTKNRNSLLKLVETLIVITSEPTFEPKDCEEMINLYMPEKYALVSNQAIIPIADAVAEAKAQLIERRKDPDKLNGIPLSYKGTNGAIQGFPSIDEILYGIRGGDLIMIGAQSGDGKTAFAMNLARIMSYHNQHDVYYINTEMEKTQMINRWASMATSIPYSNIERGRVNDSEFEEFEKWADKFSDSPLIVSQIAELTLEGVVALTKSVVRTQGRPDCIILDYIGRMDMDKEKKGMQEYQIMSYMVKKLKTLAQEQNVAFIVLAQLNDEGKLEGAKKMKNECDALFFLRPKMEKQEVDGQKILVKSDSEYVLVKEKVRRGSAKGVIHLDFDKKYQFIREM